MKIPGGLIISSLLLVSCHYRTYDTYSIYKLNLPSYPQAYEAQIFYEDDSVFFGQPVVEAKSFKVDLNPYMNVEEVNDTLQVISKDFGYDIIEVDSIQEISWKESDNSFFEYMLAALSGNELETSYSIFTAKRLHIKAYKYLKNITYADQIVRSRKTFLIDEENPKFISEQILLPSGQQQDLKGDEIIFNRINQFSERFFLDLEDEDWQFRWTEKGTLIRVNKQCKVKIKFADSNMGILPLDISLKEKASPAGKYNISIFYDQNNRIISKAILNGGKPFASIAYSYDSKNRIVQEDIYFDLVQKKYEVRYGYYNQESLWEILSPRNLHQGRFYSSEN